MHALTRIAFAVFALSLMGAAAPVRAEGDSLQCGPVADVLTHLKAQYGEVPLFSGALSTGHPITFTVSPAGTWTVLIGVDGKLCVGNSGDHWQAIAAPAAKPGPSNLPDAPALLKNGLMLIRAEGLRG